jgi:hypothetical protein
LLDERAADKMKAAKSPAFEADMTAPIKLTEKQRRAVATTTNGPVEVVDPASNRRYVLLPRDQFEKLRANGAEGSAPPSSGELDVVAPGVRRSQEAYWRDLPALLKLRNERRRWVAYHGDERVGFGRTAAELYQKCLRRGWTDADFYVDRLEPRAFPPWEAEEIEDLSSFRVSEP